jgi:hypothetical protein
MQTRCARAVLTLSLTLSAVTAARAGDGPRPAPEPDFRTASGWWADLWNIWTPVGWNDHLHRFNVLWDGTVLAKPDMNRRSQGLGLQLSLTPDFEDWVRRYKTDRLRQDDRQVRQGWVRDDAPVLWSEWSRGGRRIRSEVFAHLPGGGEVRAGDEPLFLWLRLRVRDPGGPVAPGTVQDFDLVLQAPHVRAEMTMWNNVHFAPDNALYPRRLTPEVHDTGQARSLRVLEDGARVRLAVVPGRDTAPPAFLAAPPGQSWQRVHLRLPVTNGSHVDVLLPMLSAPRQILDDELALGYDAALSETRRHWQGVTAGPTRFETPEEDVNDAIRQSVRLSHLLTEKDPATGKYSKVNGSWVYADLWATPGSMDLVMLMDTLGYHRSAERYLETFLEEQGTVKPPGPAYRPHPGYFSTPARYKSIDWLSDNGAVLYAVAMHGLLTGDPKFLERSVPGVVRSCEWIAASRRLTDHGGYPGVLPPAVATDNQRVIQGIWSIGWNYKGLCAAVRLLRKMEHPRAAEFAREAQAYREDFLKALHDKVGKAPTWRDGQGVVHRLVPTTLSGGEDAETRHAFYLDCGPLFLVFAGLLDAHDPLMQEARAYFRTGPQHRSYRHDTDFLQPPVLEHEMSSCEPCYSWNVFHSWQLGERARFLEGMYSLFAGAMSRQTRVSCETRGGITGNVFAASLAVYLARLAVIDDQLAPDELHLLRLMPRAWLVPGKEAVFRHVPTEHGPVTLTTRLSSDGQTLDVVYEPRWREDVSRVLLHIPPVPDLRLVRVNGTAVWTGGAPVVTLEGRKTTKPMAPVPDDRPR